MSFRISFSSVIGILLGFIGLFQNSLCLDATSVSGNVSTTTNSGASTAVIIPATTSPPVTDFGLPWFCDPRGAQNQTGTETETVIFVSDGTHTTTWTEACSAWVSQVQSSEASAYSSWTVWLATRQLTTSTPNITYPAFIRPSQNTQSCDIFGPLCQTGSITVAVNLTQSTTSTVVPCSQYLSYQSHSLNPSNEAPGGFPTTDGAWYTSFGRSPECHNYMYQGDALRFTNCDISKSLGPATDYLPVGYLNNQEDELIYNCCGTCSFYADQVAILFFPPADSPCLNATGGKNESEPPDKPLGSIAVYDGVTLTSPSVYIQVIGPATVVDSCGVVSPIVTNPIVGLDASDISTIHYNKPLGATYDPTPNAVESELAQLKVEDLACPTWGIGNAKTVWTTRTEDGSTSSWTEIYTTFGPPFRPVIVVPPKLLSYRPEWPATCGNYSYTQVSWMETFGVLDPPIPLTPQDALLIPATTPAVATTVDPAPPTTIADPASKPTMFAPSTEPQLMPTPPPAGGNTNNQGSSDPPQQQQDPGSGIGGVIASIFGIGSSDHASPDSPGSSSNRNGQGSAAPLIGSSVLALPSPPIDSSTTIVAGGHQIIVPKPSAAVVAGQTLTAGGRAVTSDGTVYSMAAGGNLVWDTAAPSLNGPAITTVPLPTLSPSGSSGSIVLNGHTFAVPAPSELVVDGTTLTPGGSIMATKAGIVYSVNGVGNVIVAAPVASTGGVDETKPSTMTFAGETLTYLAASGGFVVVDGKTLTPGAPAMTLGDGQVLNLGSDGMLEVGSSSTSLPIDVIPSTVTLGGEETSTLRPGADITAVASTTQVSEQQQGTETTGPVAAFSTGGAIGRNDACGVWQVLLAMVGLAVMGPVFA